MQPNVSINPMMVSGLKHALEFLPLNSRIFVIPVYHFSHGRKQMLVDTRDTVSAAHAWFAMTSAIFWPNSGSENNVILCVPPYLITIE